MRKEYICEAERIIEQLIAAGWKEQRSGTCCTGGTFGTNLRKDGQVITVQQEFHPDEEFLEQEWGEEEA